MPDIVIINPTPNMRIIAREISAYGTTIESVNVSTLPYFAPNRVFYFYAGGNAFFTDVAETSAQNDERIYFLTKGLFTPFRMMGLSQSLNAIHSDFLNATFLDLVMFRRGMLHFNTHLTPKLKDFHSLSEVIRSYPDAKIISSTITGIGNLKLCRWHTDFDIEYTFGSDYFIFCNGQIRLEAFAIDGVLYTLGKERNHIAQLTRIIPMLSKFQFQLLGEQMITKNYNPWILKHKTPNVTLLNDYSYLGASIDMPTAWYSKMATILHHTKKRKS